MTLRPPPPGYSKSPYTFRALPKATGGSRHANASASLSGGILNTAPQLLRGFQPTDRVATPPFDESLRLKMRRTAGNRAPGRVHAGEREAVFEPIAIDGKQGGPRGRPALYSALAHCVRSLNSMRRFFSRPALVLLSAMGSLGPAPRMVIRSAGVPALTSQSFTA